MIYKKKLSEADVPALSTQKLYAVVHEALM